MKSRCAARVCVLLVGALALNACARSLAQPTTVPSLAQVRSLWHEPTDVERRDLFYGPGSRQQAPGPGAFTFIERKQSGMNPGFDVRDREGTNWSVKLGREAQSEIALSRVLWAIGYYQPQTYYVEQWEMTGAVRGKQAAGRFRRELPGEEVVGEWSWYENPFIGSRPFAGLVAVNLLFNNWDLKTTNNKVYAQKSGAGTERRYVVRDLGGSLGSSRQPALLRWLPFMRYKQGSRNDLADFEEQTFIEAVEGNEVTFSYRGIDGALAGSVTMEDLRWTAALLSRLSERQWQDAFRAGGYTADESRRYIRKIHEKLAEVGRFPSRRSS